jgi:hypothetical protein
MTIAPNTRVSVTEVECAGLGYGTGLSGYAAPDHSMERAPVLQSRPPGCRTLLLSQRGLKMQAWLLNSDVIMSAAQQGWEPCERVR